MRKSITVLMLGIFLMIMFPLSEAAQKSSSPGEAREAIKDRCEKILSSKSLKGAKVSVKIVSLKDGKIIYEKNADRPLIPASNMKIITSAAALHLLKPEYTFKTSFFHDGKIEKGILKGNLYIKGYGAPDLVGEIIWIMLKEFMQSGIRVIEGDLIGDDSYFDPLERPLSWPDNPADDPYSAPLSALSCNFSSVKVVVKPERLNEKPSVHLSPFSDYIKVINKAKTKSSKNSLSLKRVYVDGENRMIISGSISPNGEHSDYRSIEGPTLYTLTSIREILGTFDMIIKGHLNIGAIPPHAEEIFTFHSRPLSKIIYDMNKNSNNFMAEMILKALGAAVIGPPGTTEKGIDVLNLFMENMLKDRSLMSFFDGSGLSKKNLLSANSLIKVLIFMDREFGEGYDFASSLPIGGADGTLKKRFTEGTITRSLRAKTGYLNGVATLSGYLENDDGERFAFAILINDPKYRMNKAQKLIDDLCRIMGRS
jgi:D-alanyl-D-alanine carboxypeptidase/D-alanyl-D-alanine-endopeptidase (penicillin-binding protein 4)